MNKLELKSDKFRKVIKEATENLQNYKLEESYKIIINALSENPDAPEPHNLLGLWYEMKKNYDLARKHYRAAYALDPTCKSASINLERVCTMFSNRRILYDFGEEPVETQIDMSKEELMDCKEKEKAKNV